MSCALEGGEKILVQLYVEVQLNQLRVECKDREPLKEQLLT